MGILVEVIPRGFRIKAAKPAWGSGLKLVQHFQRVRLPIGRIQKM